ncbi:MAG: DUF4102 domain-containing protein [Nevskiaceae bacterium]|nr:MAG: DUF4102 domain-containing protein [Nevskiaceae bacterium]
MSKQSSGKRAIHRLSAKACENSKSGVHPVHGAGWGKDYSLTDGGGLYLLVRASGSKLWQYGYRHGGKEQTLSLGPYPAVSLTEARSRHAAAREVLAAGKNPIVEARQQEASKRRDTFGALFGEWIEVEKPDWAPANLKKITALAEANLLPQLKDRPVAEVRPPELLAVLRRIEARGALEMAHRCASILDNVFGLALGSGRSETNPALGLRSLLKTPQTKHRAAITDPKLMGELMRNIAAYSGGPVVRAALRLSALTFLRPGELRQAPWSGVDFEAGEMLIPVAIRKLKTKEKRTAKPHWVPLSKQAVELLRGLHALTGRSPFIFPGERSPRTRPMSDGAVLAALRTLGYGKDTMSAHGFRGMATSALMEMGFKREAVDRQLAHKDKDAVFAAYDRSDYRDERRRMMQAWADYLDSLKREKARQAEA